MTAHQSYDDESQGSPNLEALQYLQDNWGRTEIGAAMRVSKTAVISGGTTAVTVSGIPEGAEIIDAHVICTTSNGGGTMQVQDGDANAITDAMACATADNIARASTIDTTYAIVGSSGIQIAANADADQGNVFIVYKK